MRFILFTALMTLASQATAEDRYESYYGQDDVVCLTNTRTSEVKGLTEKELHGWIKDSYSELGKTVKYGAYGFGTGIAYEAVDTANNPNKTLTEARRLKHYLKETKSYVTKNGKERLIADYRKNVQETKAFYSQNKMKKAALIAENAEHFDLVAFVKEMRGQYRSELFKKRLALAGQNLRFGALVGITVGSAVLVYEMKKSSKTPKEIFTLQPRLDGLFDIASVKLASKCQ